MSGEQQSGASWERSLAAANRLRPVLVALLAVALISVFPAHHKDGRKAATAVKTPDQSGASGPAAATPSAPAQGSESPAAETGKAQTPTGGATAGAALNRATTATTAAAKGAGSAANRTGAGSAAQPAAVAVAPTGAGLSSPAALAEPTCDPKTKRLKVSFTRAAPCAVAWAKGGDNGGATTPGVTADSIKVVIYNPSPDASNPPIGNGSEADLLAGYRHASEPFERFYQQWGRKAQYVVFNATGNDEVAQRADAIKIAALKPFAIMQVSAGLTVLITELAARKIVTIANAAVSQALASKLAPYVWGAGVPPGEQVAVAAGNYVGKRLLNHPAKWSGQTEQQVLNRKFGLLYTSDVDPKIFDNELSKYGGQVTTKQPYSFGAAEAPRWTEQSRTLVSRMKTDGVNNVVALADFLFLAVITKEATNQQWFPEWTTTGLLGNDIDIMAKTFDQLQWRHAFGIGGLYPASSLRAPQFHFQEWYWGKGNESTGAGLGMDETPLLFSGIHGSGPKLTAEGFRDGVFSVAPTGGATNGGLMTMVWSYGRWGYWQGDDYNGYDDFDEIWWDATGHGRDNLLGQDGVGVYRHVNGGKRYFYNQFPEGEPKMFDMDGVAPFYEDYPTPQERPPDYPCAGCPSAAGK